jgi:DNA-binding NarL/FixJ family response regulator
MEKQEQTRILIAEEKAAARWALREYLQAQPGLDVVAEAADGASLLEQTQTTCPDLILLEWGLPGPSQAALFAALRNLDCQPLMVVLGNQPEFSSPATDAGADAFVFRGHGPKQVVTTILWLVSETRYA